RQPERACAVAPLTALGSSHWSNSAPSKEAVMLDRLSPSITTLPPEWLAATWSQSRQFDRSEALKRGFDMIAASLLLVLVLPAFLGIAMLIKCTSSGPVLFWQNR